MSVWKTILLVVCCLLCFVCLTSPAWLDTWASNIVKNHETYNMDKIAMGKIERTIDCYGYPTIKLSNMDMNKVLYVFNDSGNHIDAKYLREDVTYTLYKIRLWGNWYYLECGGE